MKAMDQVTVTFDSRSANEGFARAVAACFASQLDPTLDEVADVKTAVSTPIRIVWARSSCGCGCMSRA